LVKFVTERICHSSKQKPRVNIKGQASKEQLTTVNLDL